MKLLEHEAKQLLQQAGVAIPSSQHITKTSRRPAIQVPVVLKSQVRTGGRGKLGGIILVETKDKLTSSIDTLFSLQINGFLPNVILAEEKIDIERELYISLFIDRETSSIRLLAHPHGGMDVEEQDTNKLFNREISTTLLKKRSADLTTFFNLSSSIVYPFLASLFQAFVKNDATLLEINPLILTRDGKLVAGDCKIELDDMAAFRHLEWKFEDTPASSNFVILNKRGNIGSMANGAGLAMATVDAINASGLKAANFLDIGGGANTQSILAAFSYIASFPHIQAIIINIFAGITRCDEVARAIIEAKKQIPKLPPLYIRLAGTHFEEAVSLLNAEEISTLASLEECVIAAKRNLHE